MEICEKQSTSSSKASTNSFGPEPIVRLESYFESPYNLSVAAARSCYSSRIISAQDVDRDEQSRALRDKIAQSIYKAGHHTTIQHATFQFAIERVSRQFLWSFLHAHPFYNSEQVSQRYVEVKPGNFSVPSLSSNARAVYLSAVDEQMRAYSKLSELVEPMVKKEYKKLFPARKLDEKRWQLAVKKRCQEVGRYLLPVATHAHLYHTISGLTLHRYWRLCEQFDAPLEQRLVVRKMVDEVAKIDPKFMSLAEEPIAFEDTLEYKIYTSFNRGASTKVASGFIAEFDAELGAKVSKLIDYKINSENTMAQAVRSVLGLTKNSLSDKEALQLLLSPAKNPYLSDTLNLNTMSKLTRAMFHPHFTFKKKISHSADSQDQRHRMCPASRPVLSSHFVKGHPDYIVPTLVAQGEEALEFYRNSMNSTWQAIDKLLDLGEEIESAMYLLPNAFPIRFEESGDLLNLHHKWMHRLCYGAQEEIWNASLQEVLQVKERFPDLGQYLLAPCWFRSEGGVRPVCPEGERFCGVPVWKLPLEEYERII
jgi:flavin-dependent thymidylate synthase